MLKFTPEICHRMWMRVKMDVINNCKHRSFMCSYNILNQIRAENKVITVFPNEFNIPTVDDSCIG